MKWWIGGLVLSSAICIAIISPLFHMKVYEPFIALILALLVSVLAVRALGETGYVIMYFLIVKI